MESYSICPFVFGLFHLVQCPQDSYMLWHVSELSSFLRLNNVPLCVYTTFCLSVHPSLDTWVASTFGCCDPWCYGYGGANIWSVLASILLTFTQKWCAFLHMHTPLSPPIFSQCDTSIGSAPGKQDEGYPPFPSYPVLGNVHHHCPVHCHQCSGLLAVSKRHQGQHNP